MQTRATGQAPYGFQWNESRLVSNGEEAVIRRTIFDLFVEHRSKGRVARILKTNVVYELVEESGVTWLFPAS